MRVLSIKVLTRKKFGNLFNEPCALLFTRSFWEISLTPNFPEIISAMWNASKIWTCLAQSISNKDNNYKVYIRGSLNKFPGFFRMGTFIKSTHIKL